MTGPKLVCPLCGTDWDPNCPNATPESWDPTVGTRAGDDRTPLGGRP